MEFNALCPIKETIRILEPEEEWRLLAKVVGADLVAGPCFFSRISIPP